MDPHVASVLYNTKKNFGDKFQKTLARGVFEHLELFLRPAPTADRPHRFVYDIRLNSAASDDARARWSRMRPALERLPADAYDYFMYESLLYGRLTTTGVKIYYPTPDEFRVCSQTEIGVPWEDFAMPFPLMFVVIPAECAKFLPPYSPSSTDHFSRLVAIYQSAEVLCCNIYFFRDGVPPSPATTATSNFMIGPVADELIEDRLNRFRQSSGVEVFESIRAYARLCLNYSLMVMSSGATRLENDPRARAEAERAACRKPGRARRRELDRNVTQAAEYYRLAQTVEVGQWKAFSSNDASVPDGWKLKPHWRRSHWALQPYGPGGTLRKRILRPFVFVKPGAFKGKNIDTVYEGRTRPEPERPA